MSQVQISPISAAQHFATAAAFWEQQAKLLRHELDEANYRLADLKRQAASVAAGDEGASPDAHHDD